IQINDPVNSYTTYDENNHVFLTGPATGSVAMGNNTSVIGGFDVQAGAFTLSAVYAPTTSTLPKGINIASGAAFSFNGNVVAAGPTRYVTGAMANNGTFTFAGSGIVEGGYTDTASSIYSGGGSVGIAPIFNFADRNIGHFFAGDPANGPITM